MRIFILGASSFLGRSVTEALSSSHEITALVRSEEARQKVLAVSPRTRVVNENECSHLGSFDLAMNFIVDYGKGKSLSEVMEVNLVTPLRFLEKITFKSFLNFSTALPENVSAYAFSKHALEKTTDFFESQTIHLRIQQFYGPGAPDHNFITHVLKKMKKNERLELTDCEHSRDFIYIQDLLSAVLTVVNNLGSLSQREVIDVGTGEAPRLKDVIQLAQNISASSSDIAFGAVPKRKNEPDVLRADISRLKALGWLPRFTLKAGLTETYARL